MRVRFPLNQHTPLCFQEEHSSEYPSTTKTKYFSVFLFFAIIFVRLPTFFATNNYNAHEFGRRVVTTPFGIVRGETILPTSDDDLPAVTQFLGIPYGVAPLGPNRFNMAISAPKWTHQPKEALSFAPACLQSGLPQLSEAEALKTMSSQRFDAIHRIFPMLKPQSEDCLYMNLYVPERLERFSGDYMSSIDTASAETNFQHSHNNLLSVLVIVHGGGDSYGWGAGNAYNASILASRGQILVVTLNYRLGVYGFLGRCESRSCTGNAGLSDLVAALKMLSNILSSFNANPASITLLGWGSGAALVSLLMASPITQPKNRLFRRAILLDGSALCPWAMTDNSQQFLLRMAQELQCINEKQSTRKSTRDSPEMNTEIDDYRSIEKIVKCIQENSVQNLTAATRKIHSPTFTSAFAPIVDGQIVPNHPQYSFNAKYGALFREIDLMVGTVSHPAHHLIPSVDLENGVDVARRDHIFRTLVRNLFAYHRAEIFDAITYEYTDWDNPKDHPKTLRNKLLDALSDALFTAPLVRTARMHSTDEFRKTSNTFFFVFSHETQDTTASSSLSRQSGYRDESIRSLPPISSSSSPLASGIRGALSEEHLPYLLGIPLLATFQRESQDFNPRFTANDKAISRVLIQYISNFVKSGDPSRPNPISTLTSVEERFFGTPWPQYNIGTREAYLEISQLSLNLELS